MIRIDALWLATTPVDMRMGTERLLARVVQVFGSAQAHHGYLFANARGNRIKLLLHDGFGMWCAAMLARGVTPMPPASSTVVPEQSLSGKSLRGVCTASMLPTCRCSCIQREPPRPASSRRTAMQYCVGAAVASVDVAKLTSEYAL